MLGYTKALLISFSFVSALVINETIMMPAWLSGTSSADPIPRLAAPVIAFDKCDYNSFYLDIARALNKIVKKKNAVMDEGEEEIIFQLCMNRRLMWAAKVQSDFQSLINEPTHSGPRVVSLGSIEERVQASGFKLQSGLIPPEEIIYYWPQYPEEFPDRKSRKKFIFKAIKQIFKDPVAHAILLNKNYRFFGAAITRRPDSQAYMTLVLADSNDEQCHECVLLANGEPSKPRNYKKMMKRLQEMSNKY